LATTVQSSNKDVYG